MELEFRVRRSVEWEEGKGKGKGPSEKAECRYYPRRARIPPQTQTQTLKPQRTRSVVSPPLGKVSQREDKGNAMHEGIYLAWGSEI